MSDSTPPPRPDRWTETLKLVAAVAVVALLLLITLELRQIRNIGVSAGEDSYVANLGAARNAINQHAELWARGSNGGSLSPEEEVVFGNLVVMQNDLAFFDYMKADRMGNDGIARLIMDDFAAFLYERPGAHRVWLAREEKLIANRSLLSPEEDDLSFWKDSITASMEKLGGGMAALSVNH